MAKIVLRCLIAIIALSVLLSISPIGKLSGSGMSETLVRLGGPFQHNKIITAPDGFECEYFGVGLAANSRFLAVIKNYQHLCVSGPYASKNVYLYENASGAWNFSTIIRDDEQPFPATAVRKVAMDEDRLLVSYYDPANPSGTASSYVAIYRYDQNHGWELESRLLPPDSQRDRGFGYNLDIEGDTLVIGAPYAYCGDYPYCGALFVYTFDGFTWNPQQKIVDIDYSSANFFGFIFDLEAGELFAGDPEQNEVNYYRQEAGQWILNQVITTSDLEIWSDFGSAVSVDGETLVIGAGRDSLPGGTDQGSARVFTRQDRMWVETAVLSAPDGQKDNAFGFAGTVDIEGDTIVVGAYRHTHYGMNPVGYGSVYVFRKPEAGWSTVTPVQEITYPHTVTFGVGIMLQGNTLIIGSSGETVGANENQGAVHIFYQGISIASDRPLELYEGGNSASLRFVLESQPTEDVYISFETDNTIFSVTPSTLQFAAGDWDQPKEVKVSAVDNCTIDRNRYLQLTITTSSSDLNYHLMDIPVLRILVMEKAYFHQDQPVLSEGNTLANILFLQQQTEEDVYVSTEAPDVISISPNPFGNSPDSRYSANFSMTAQEDQILLGNRQVEARFLLSSVDPFYDQVNFCMKITILEDDYYFLFYPLIYQN